MGGSEKVRRLLESVHQISPSSAAVLIIGETGTGKELVAHMIHEGSPRARRNFVAVNCAAVPPAWLEGELFGIEPRVATGVDRRIGRFEEADGGALFLDEIGDLEIPAQAKILRALQERKIIRVGGSREIPVDLRIIAATNKDLEAEIRRGAFRADLYYRLRVVLLHTPPLREIADDIPLLASQFLDHYTKNSGKPRKHLPRKAVQALLRYDWPGNVRELENEMKRIAVCLKGVEVGENDPASPVRESFVTPGEGMSKEGSLKARTSALERSLILPCPERNNFNKLRTARQLGLSRQGLMRARQDEKRFAHLFELTVANNSARKFMSSTL